MKRVVAGFAFMILMAIGAQAQDSTRHHKNHHRKGQQKEAVYQKLNLSEAQKQQMNSVQADYRNKITELRKNDGITVKEMRERRKALATEHRQSVEKILTAEQKAQLQEMRKKSNRVKHAGSTVRKDQIKSELKLTEEQSAKVKAANKEFRAKMREIRSNSAIDETGKKEKYTTLRKEHQVQLNTILTPEQQQKLNEIRKSHPAKNRTR